MAQRTEQAWRHHDARTKSTLGHRHPDERCSGVHRSRVVPRRVTDHDGLTHRHPEALRCNDETGPRGLRGDEGITPDDDVHRNAVMMQRRASDRLGEQGDHCSRETLQLLTHLGKTRHRDRPRYRSPLMSRHQIGCLAPAGVSGQRHQDRHRRQGRSIPVSIGHLRLHVWTDKVRQIMQGTRIVGEGLQIHEGAIKVKEDGPGMMHDPMVHNIAMADNSFDIVSKLDRAEIDNAVNQTAKELTQRFDFKGTGAQVEFKGEMTIDIEAETEDRARAALEVLKEKLVKRGISLKVLDAGEPRSSGRLHKIACQLKEGITQEQAKKLAKLIRDEGPKKVKTQVTGDELRISSPSRDDLQAVMALVKDADLDFPVQFVNYR